MLSQLSTKKPVAAVKGAAPKKFYGKNGAIFLPPTIGREEQAGAQVLCTFLQGAATVAGNRRPTVVVLWAAMVVAQQTRIRRKQERRRARTWLTKGKRFCVNWEDSCGNSRGRVGFEGEGEAEGGFVCL